MPKKTTSSEKIKRQTGSSEHSATSFEASLNELEQIVTRLESGDLALEDALNEFERGIQLARLGQQTLKQAEQRVQILLNDDPDAPLAPFTSDTK